MSRFFRAAGDSDTESESEEEELLSSGEDEAPAQAAKPKPIGMSRFLRTEGSEESSSGDDDDDDDEDEDEAAAPQAKKPGRFGWGGDNEDESDEGERVVVKSARDKRMEEMEASSKSIDNGVKINDWVAINNEFDKFGRLVQRQTNVSEPVPPIYLRTLINLEKSVNTALTKEKEAKKKMNATNSRALNGMKQKVKKTLKELEIEVKAFQEDPDAFEAKYNSVVSVAPAPPPPTRPSRTAAGDEGAAIDGVEPTDDFTTVGKGGKTYNFTADAIFKTLATIHESRGKKNTDRVETMRILEKLLEVAVTPYSRIRVLLALISARFDYNPSISSHMPVDIWNSAQKEVDRLIAVLSAEPHYVVQERVELDYDELLERVPGPGEGEVVLIRGSIISSVDRLDDEFTKSLQNMDPHGTEYVDRLKDSMGLYQTICRAQAYFESKNQTEAVIRVIMRRVEHIYSKPDAVVQALESAAAGPIASLNLKVSVPTLSSCQTSTSLVHTLCVHLYKTDNSLLRTRAVLCHIYHHALHNDFHTARDMLLMSHLGESIQNADVTTQVLYNRALVQVGLAAFRTGLIKEAQSTLQDIFTTQRVKELLAQGVHQPKFGTVLTPEQERAERSRQLPFHLHINTELLEAAFLVSSMLVEIPLLASIDNEEAKRKAVSKPFKRLLDFADRQVFTGPPETTRDHIMQASKALQDGQWEKAKELVLGIKVWGLMPEEKQVKEMLGRRIQEDGLRTYLFTNSAFYTTLSLDLLATTFSLPARTVSSLVSRMIWSDELSASLDYLPSPDGSDNKMAVVVFHRVELTRVQQLAQTLADKVNIMVESNEKALDVKLGGGPGTGGWGDGDKKAAGEAGAGQEAGNRRTTRGRGRGGARGARFSQGLGNRMEGGRNR